MATSIQPDVEVVVSGGSGNPEESIMDYMKRFDEANGAFIKRRDEADSAFAEKSGRTNPEVAGNRELEGVSITIVPDKPEAGKFVIEVNTTSPEGICGAPSYRAEAYGEAPNVTPATFSGSLSLSLPGGWDAFLKPPEVTFGWVECSGSDFMGWEVSIDNKAVMTFGGFVPRDEALVGKGGKMVCPEESMMDYMKNLDEARAAFIKQRDEADSAFAKKTGRTNSEIAGNRALRAVSITIVPDKPEPGKFVIKVSTTSPPLSAGGPCYRAEAYGEAPNVTPATFSGSLSLTLPGGWDAFMKPPEVTFGWVECSGSDFMGWEVYIDNKTVMTFGGFVPRDEALVGKGGKMIW
ncbi:hypothetical protein FRC01_005523 [Tulasnella sp. 417]|nr:hypothetical protein FRC01_005523 [Tulasnella sp. 417]